MRGSWLVLTIALTAILRFDSFARAQEPVAGAPPSRSERFQQIARDFNQKLRSGEPVDRDALVQQRDADLRALLAEIDAIAPDKLTADDHRTAASAHQVLGESEQVIPHAERALALEPDREDNYVALVRALASLKRLDDAERVFADANAKFPDAAKVQALRIVLAMGQKNSGAPAKAIEHLQTYLDKGRAGLFKAAPASTPTYLRQIDELQALLDAAERQAEVIPQLDRELAAAREAASNGNSKLPWIAAELVARKIAALAAEKKLGAAREYLAQEIAAAREAAGAHPMQADWSLPLVPLLAARVVIADGAEAQQQAQAECFALLVEQSKQFADSPEVLSACVQSPARMISQLLSSEQLEAAMSALEAAQKFATEIKPQGAAAEQAFAVAKTSLANIERRIATELGHAQLIGKDAFPLAPEAWVNGAPLAPADLQGKVVLLDFWAVWCGPCIATFPHLREWQEKFADKGLVIVGVTNYYKYGWNAAEQRAEPVDDLTAEQEQEALVEFAKHHQLTHRFAIMPEESEFARNYGVAGIPQVVVIDREGKIRLIRVGSGPENAAAIESVLKQLLGDPQTPCP